MLVRREGPHDAEAIDQVHRLAFAVPGGRVREPVEVGLVHALRSSPAWIPQLSLVAERAGRVVGHTVATRGQLARGEAVALGPIGVMPEHQHSGVGAALLHASLAAADALDLDVVVLLGHTGYYPRFGFVPADTLGIEAPDPNWGEHFQARRLAGWRDGLGGRFRYPAPFSDLGVR